MQQYLAFLAHIRDTGVDKSDRTGVGIRSVFGYQMRFNLERGFPLLTTKKLHLKSIVHELLWFLKGDTNTAYLREHGVTIWDEWANANGELGPVYGHQWRHWSDGQGGEIDQMAALIDGLKNNPDSRRHIVSAWNVAQLDRMALPPCHLLMQFYVAHGRLSCQLYQRSADAFLGVPFNIASYALLTHLIADQCNLGVAEFIWSGGDCHIYANHFEQVREQLSRDPRDLPQLRLKSKRPAIDQYEYDDFEWLNYKPYPAIKAPIAV